MEQEIYCDECGVTIQKDRDLIRTQIVGRNENGEDVEETYFECPHCGKHYTVTVFDRSTKILIQKRGQIRRKLARKSGRYSSVAARRRLIEEDEDLKEDIQARSAALKAKYLEGGVI